MGNPIAYLMLALWPFICLVLFRTQKLERALIWSILGGYLFLPPLTEFNLPLVPAMDKVSIPNLSVLLIMVFGMQQKVRLLPESRLAMMLVVGFVLCAIPTVMTNGDPIIFQVLRGADPILFYIDQLPGQSTRDIASVLIAQALMIVPFLLARQFLSSEDGLREILRALMIGVLIYSIPSLIEIRFSPQTNVMVYGFFQHSFEQTMRAGGFRPIVFLPHGLWLALLVCMAVMATAALAKTTEPIDRWKIYLATLYLFFLLILCKSMASLAYALVLVPVILFAPLRWQLRIAAVFAIIAVTYPMLRNMHLIPIDVIVEQAYAFNEERGQSLEYRILNEEQLLTRAAEKPMFGWGGWGRSLIRDPETGEILTIPDGRWIIIFGTFGWLGYICEMGLLALPLILIWLSQRGPNAAPISPYLPALCLILGITMMDMLLNATLTPLTWLTAGAILGHAERRMPRSAQVPRFALSGAAMDTSAAMESTPAVPKGKRTIL